MSTPSKRVREYFPRVAEARQALKERAIEILESYLAVIAEARAAGDHETAAKSLQWLMDHMPDDAGERMLESSVDKPKQLEQAQGPKIQIGIALGGINQPKQLATQTVIDVEPNE